MIDPASAIGFDVDGVIADTMSLFIDILRQDYNIHHIHYNDIRTYELEECLDLDPGLIQAILSRIIDGHYTAVLNPIPGAVRVLSRISRFRNPLLLVTARPESGPLDQWMNSIFSTNGTSVEIIAVGASAAKIDLLKQRSISCFVEDRLETCHLLDRADITPILFRQPWNREPHPFIEISSWEELEAMVEFT
ncbi:MAG: haloacid dehalogenase [Desulfobacteraceae bacterium]|nr:haloacid dehalogenase [Desulfobacteraceae bacterium]